MKTIIGAFLAAALSFGWGALSWMVLDWHQTGLHGFANEEAVVNVLRENVKAGSGTYVLPYKAAPSSVARPDEIAAQGRAYQVAVESGPAMYAIVRPGKNPTEMPMRMALAFGRSFFACLIIALLLQGTVIPYAARIAFTAGAGLFAGLAVDAPLWVWFDMTGSDLFIAIADHIIEWSLAGVVLGLFCGREPTFKDGY